MEADAEALGRAGALKSLNRGVSHLGKLSLMTPAAAHPDVVAIAQEALAALLPVIAHDRAASEALSGLRHTCTGKAAAQALELGQDESKGGQPSPAAGLDPAQVAAMLSGDVTALQATELAGPERTIIAHVWRGDTPSALQVCSAHPLF